MFCVARFMVTVVDLVFCVWFMEETETIAAIVYAVLYEDVLEFKKERTAKAVEFIREAIDENGV